MLSPRTAKYIEALNREGDNFDYDEWLQTVREEEAQEKRVSAGFTSGEPVIAETGKPNCAPDHRDARINSPLKPKITPVRISRVLGRLNRDRRTETPTARLRRRLLTIRGAWGDFQRSRARDAAYPYLEAVFGIVEHHRVRRKTRRLLRHAFEFADLPFDSHADPFTAVIRCTCDDNADNKMISKWARALRYVAYCHVPRTEVRAFMRQAGGVNVCAARYARYYGRCGR
jgi:hypothetical protein